MRVWPGRPYPLGATWDGRGVNLALYSEHATRVEVCLFASAEERHVCQTVTLPEQTDLVWHGYFPDLRPGAVYGYRVHEPSDPHQRHRFRVNKTL
ncbi:MAG: hypothetical protein ACKO3P_05730 [Planctomycetaceae bacterium]